jgi:hypothetical protein
MPLDPKANFSHWKRHGYNYSQPLLEAGATINYDGYGLMVFNGTFKVADKELPSSLETATIPLYGDEVFKGSGLYVSKIQKRYNADKTISYDVEAVGIEARYKGKTAICIQGMNTCNAEPIETHWNFEAFAGTPAKRLNGATFDKEGRFTGFAKLPDGGKDAEGKPVKNFAGIRSYLAPRITLRGYFHIEQKQLDESKDWLNRMSGLTTKTGDIMSIQLIPAYIIAGNPTRDYLLTSITPENIVIDTQGKPKIVKVTYELMSAANGSMYGWNKDIYINGSSI